MSLRNLYFVLILLSLLGIVESYAQVTPPVKRKFNVGLYDGLGGLNLSLIPLVDVSVFHTTLRFSAGADYYGMGFTQEILPVSKIFYNWFWIGSGYYSSRRNNSMYSANIDTQSNSYSVLTGLKVYFGNRWYSQFQLGASNSTHTTPGLPTRNETGFYYEFGIGMNIFSTFLPKKKD
ncbi:MAG: hypothetical protein ACK40G_06005 [Cytophagaceae bacterium]